MVRVTLALSVPPPLSIAVTESVKAPAAAGVPLMANVPLPLCVVVNPAGSPKTLALDSGRAEPINRLPVYVCP